MGCAEGKLTGILAGIGRMIASVPESKVMDVYNSVGTLVDPNVPAYLMSTVKEADAKAAYAALVDFAGVVKANPITPSTPASSVSGGSIGAAAGKLSAAAYPFIKDVDWTSDLFLKPIPGGDPQKVMKAVDKMIVMGSAMDGALGSAALYCGLCSSLLWCRERPCRCDRRCCRQAFESRLPVHEGGALELLSLLHQSGFEGCRRLGEGHRQDDRHGSSHGHEVAQSWG